MDYFIYIFIFVIIQLFLIPAYNSFYLWLFTKYKIKYVKVLTIFSNIITPIILTILFINFGYNIILQLIRSKDFDSVVWKENINERYKMLNDLKENKIIGITKEEVLKMLGPSDGECGYLTNELNICYLTNDPYYSGFLDHSELVIRFNENLIVVSVSHESI